jgi:hypothetical protein
MGTQLCNLTGNGYGACTGCPAAAAGAGAGAGASSPAAGAGAGGALAPNAGTSGGPAGAGSGGAAGDAGGEADPAGSEVKGVACGVGLPILCELGTQICCVRSLETDTCIAANAACTCQTQGCAVMETECDGPEDCDAGQVCCGTLASNQGGYDNFACAAQCQSTGNQRIACHAGGTACPSGLVCANSQLLTNVQVCIDPATIEQ